MSEYTIIRDVGLALSNVLWANFKSDNKITDIIAETQITFDSPAEMTNDAKLSIFLFRISENPFMQNQEMAQMNAAQLAFQPYIVDLHFLITPQTKDKTKDHLLLGKILQIFHDYPILRKQDFQEIEPLKNSTEEFRVTFNPLPIENMTEIWNLFRDKPYMLSLCYQVTPVKIDSGRKAIDTPRIIEERDVRSSQVTTFKLLVELKDESAQALKPTDKVLVTLSGAGQTQTQKRPDAQGYYVFENVLAGMYTIETKARDYGDTSQEISLPQKGADPKKPVVQTLTVQPNS